MTRPIIRIGHSPDADDAFMFYALARNVVRIPGYDIQHLVEDIQSLNRRAQHGMLEVSAVSAAAYPLIADRYRILHAGAAVGNGYGPTVVSTSARSIADLHGSRIAIPGTHTTAFLLLQLCADNFIPVDMPFDAIPDAVLNNQVDAGVVIHESQITYQDMGLHSVIDLGAWWQQETGLPVLLGLDVVRRDLGEALCQQIATALHDSIDYALSHEEQALDYALQFGRGVDREVCRRFVRMYVNDQTRQIDTPSARSLHIMYERSFQRGLIPAIPPLDFL